MVADCEYTPDEDNNNSTVDDGDNGNNGDNGSSDQEPTIPLMRLPQLSLRFPPRSSTGKALLSIVISALILSSNVNLLTIRGFLMLLTMTVLLYIIIASATGGGAGLSLPDATNPLPPHLGHDGVSLEVRGM